MITVEEALFIISQNTRNFGTESIPLDHGIGRVLREDIVADRDFPPYNRVTMDGIAIAYNNFAKDKRRFVIEGIAAAGSPQMNLINSECCLEVMTGSIMPEHADTVIRYEDVEIVDGTATITINDITFQQNIHFQGQDRKAGDEILNKGKVLSPSEIGVCATVGKTDILVSRLPKTLIISTGDELVDIHETPLRHQIRRSNVYRLKTTLSHYGIAVETAHLDDDYNVIIKDLGNYLKTYDLVILSGGVSKGKFDFLPEALEELGVQKLFHKIKQRPGKPFWFGNHPNGCTVFALPGNPVSSFLCTHRYFKPWLDQSLGKDDVSLPFAKLAEDVNFKPDLTYFLEVRLKYNEDATIEAWPVKGNGSGDLANLVDADAFIQLPQGKDTFNKGEIYPVFLYR